MKYNIKVLLLLLSAIIFLVPSNLFIKIAVDQAYVNGLLVDYLIPKFYLSDIFIIILLLLWLIKVIKNKTQVSFKKENWAIYFLLPIFIVRQLLTPYPLAAVWYVLKIAELSLLFLFLNKHQPLLKKPLIYFTIVSTIIFQSSLAIWQFLTQKTFLGFRFFGEPNLANSIGLTKDMWWHTGRVLPYATTPHPNILGGILAIFSLFLITNNQNKILTSFCVSLALIIIVLTQSISALSILISGLLLLALKPHYQQVANFKKKMTIGLIVMFFIMPVLINLASKLSTADSLARRDYLQNAALEMLRENLIFGVGLNQFAARVEEYSSSKEVVRFVQPVHHVGMLWVAETGLLGIILLLIIGKKINWGKATLPLLILLPIISLDHYLLTQQSGMLLFVLQLNHIGRWSRYSWS